MPPMDGQELRTLRVRLVRSFVLMSFAGGAGTAGYWLLWREQGGTFLDAMYMTVITMTTIGFQEVKPLSGIGRVMTMAIAVCGIGSLFYMLTATMDYIVSGQLLGLREKRRMEKRIAALAQHIIIAGLGRVGREAAREMSDSQLPFVIVDPSDAAREHALQKGYLFIQGDCSSDEVLEQAGVTRARGLVATTDSDATNMYVVMSARLLNPNLHIVSRVVDETSIPKLLRAGANQAISPYAIGGRRLAHLILSPAVVDFFETALLRGNKSLSIEEYIVSAGSNATRQKLEALRIPQVAGATLLAVIREGATLVNPPGDTLLRAGDHLLALGTEEQLQGLARLLEAKAP